jgi:hypothetical protein
MAVTAKRLDLDITLSAEQYEAAQKGLIPNAMEDKWFIYFEDGWLNFHRSWTGYCIYRLRFEPQGDSYTVAEAWVNQDPSQYGNLDDSYDVYLVRSLIDRVLSYRPRGFF